jgi:hypothetical protein
MRVLNRATVAVSAILVMAMTAMSAAQASYIPPHFDVVTQCQQVSAVYVSESGRYRKYDAHNASRVALKAMAARTPRGAWVESGCRR